LEKKFKIVYKGQNLWVIFRSIDREDLFDVRFVEHNGRTDYTEQTLGDICTLVNSHSEKFKHKVDNWDENIKIIEEQLIKINKAIFGVAGRLQK
jgi:hypothetical protein